MSVRGLKSVKLVVMIASHRHRMELHTRFNWLCTVATAFPGSNTPGFIPPGISYVSGVRDACSIGDVISWHELLKRQHVSSRHQANWNVSAIPGGFDIKHT